ncbi:MAG: ATP-binding cassette domain-containing protein [Rickettsiales bacterium]
MTKLIQARNISVIRQEKHILKNVSLSVNAQDFITIIGPNGAGKSMLLKCLMDFYKPDTGTIIRKKGLKLGYVPQRIIPDSTIPITVHNFLKLHKKYSSEIFERTVQDTSTEHLLKKQLSVLSGGELQRVLLARGLLGNPELLILDEPAQNLDISGQIAFYKLLEKIYKENPISILMVSHDLHMVMASTKQVVCLFHHICCSGAPHIVTKDPEFISLFGNDMANMMAVYQHSHNHNHREEYNA